MSRPRIVIVGGGFAGLKAARHLKRADVDITLIDRRNFHLFQPLLYQVATGGLSPANIASPLRGILARQRNVQVRKGEVTGFDAGSRHVLLENAQVPFDWLIVATGSTDSYFGNDHWRKIAPGLKTVEQALEIRRLVLSAFELAEHEPDPARRRDLMTFVIVGGGPTGVELAGALSELANHTLRGSFRNIDTTETRICIVEMSDRLLGHYDPKLSREAAESLRELGVELKLGTRVEEMESDRVVLDDGEGQETIGAGVILWAAGVKASPLGRELGEATGAEVDDRGRVVVNRDLSVADHDTIFVLGDLASAEDEEGNPLPGVAPVAMQQGKYVARLIRRRLSGKRTEPFRYRDLGSMAVIGRSAAVAEVGKLRFHGFIAWLAWLFIHLINLVEFQNRVLVLLQWSFNYISRNRSARLITNEQRLPEYDDLLDPAREETESASS